MARACPICPDCGSRKFERLPGGEKARLKCRSCGAVSEI